jgi:DNA-binding GntR family transcriptional regulator
MDSTLPAAERVYLHVRAAVLEHRYAAGTLLTEGEIADEVGVSRTPVREALLRLESQGLLRLYPKKGALVLPVSAQEVEDVFEARELVESFAARKVWSRRAQLLPELQELVDRMRSARKVDDATALMAADREFHAAIVAAAGNSLLERFYASLRDRQMCMGVAAMKVSPDRMDRAVAEHAAIITTLRSGTAAQFRALVHEHVVGAADHLRSVR